MKGHFLCVVAAGGAVIKSTKDTTSSHTNS